MKIFYKIILLHIILYVISCSNINEPIEPPTKFKYIGNIGTERNYIESERWYKNFPDSVYYKIPDSLKSKVFINSVEQMNGVTIIDKYKETIVPIDENMYVNWELSLPKENYFQIESYGESYNLADELDSLVNNKVYSIWQHSFSTSTYEISSEGVSTTTFKSYQKFFPSCLYIKNNMKIGDSWVIYQHVDNLTNEIIEEKISEVVSKENVTTKAGTFMSYKIKITTIFHNTISSLVIYEYYAPNVGLVLSEFEGWFKLYIINLLTNETETMAMYRIVRKELTSFSFIK